jgi:hypothetical protein
VVGRVVARGKFSLEIRKNETSGRKS